GGFCMVGRLAVLGVFLMACVAGAAADVAGDWDVSITTSDATITGKASLKRTGETVTGWVGPEGDPIPITGVVRGDKLTIRTSPQPGRTVAFDRCDLTISGDKMAGTIDTDKGKIEFVRSTQ